MPYNDDYDLPPDFEEVDDDVDGHYGRCPDCGRRIWVESGCLPACDHCGWEQGDETMPDELDVEDEDRLI